MAFESVVQALHPVKVVVWGEQAIGFLGAGTLLNSYMLIPSESDFDLAAQKLVEAGFRPALWSYGILDPHLLPDDEITRRINPMEIPGYRMLDDNSVRFQFPAGFSGPERVVLLRSTYVCLTPPNDPLSMQRFHCDKNLYYPDKALLLESFIRTLLQDSPGFWRDTLGVWAISYVYGILMVEDTVLDSCDEESVRLWFNEKIRRGKGGLDRTTVSKRVGKGQALTK
ncbi:hypothetical protein K458DRAFT_434587 [Lentithecium fluviatile CBS 122367]|uniref:Uncharacterized protein n=1 Tax=Lentithecium fluviatile CBS 122367 TaxID=1168545 RepID=A0A6G1IPN8_9PLEO|nr:hypothetical protein K458DRAFT_434587 [Lentithecium fluviatile CBS 122367]